ncbi:hypothetical protein MKEN_00388900 [Mycena kentingensis (nom. inval.)]|nr:hypothetical protein MKEN_00388900 [Mycena kentingensis (nom. inval.)]
MPIAPIAPSALSTSSTTTTTRDGRRWRKFHNDSSAKVGSFKNATGNLIDFEDAGYEDEAVGRAQNESVHGCGSTRRTRQTSQMQATKNLLTEAQRIAYVGLCSLVTQEMAQHLNRKEFKGAVQSLDLSALKIMAVALSYGDRDARCAIRYRSAPSVADDVLGTEQKIESLAIHGVQAVDLVPAHDDPHLCQPRHRRRPLARHRRTRRTIIGLATLGGGLVIGLSTGLLAPVIGAGLGAALGTVGITETTGFLAGAGGAAILPLHNHKWVSAILTVPGFMTGKLDDIRLPFSITLIGFSPSARAIFYAFIELAKFKAYGVV